MTNKFDTIYYEVINEGSLGRILATGALATGLSLSPLQAKESRGIRNNNPGNVELTSDVWVGSSGDDGRFVTFNDSLWGIRAIGVILRSYTIRHNLNTIEEYITRWAPPEENDTESYIKNVSNLTNIARDKQLNIFDKSGKVVDGNKLKSLMKAIITHENGSKYAKHYSDIVYNDAIGLIK